MYIGRGGKREGAGRKSPWKHSKTELIRVPVEFVEQVLDFARRLDNGERVSVELVKDIAPPNQLSLLSSELLSDEHLPFVVCPRCGSSQLYKDGRVKDGRQKYGCKDCRHKFAPR